jgi:benzoyl-CoA reductase/2-hydroxyglutaryl-CoA dehydratase subunit BcrC/BadD/HgdB
MMQPYFENLAASLDARIRSGVDEVVARKVFAREVARLGTRLFSGGHTVAWCGVVAPFDVLNAMGVTSCFVEFVGAVLASTGGVEPMLELAEEEGYSPDSCGYHRAVTGATLRGMMPRPDFLIATSAPCTGGLAAIQNLARHFERDLFVLHIPHHDGPEAVAFLAEQLREMTRFVAEHTGHPLEEDRLREAVETTNHIRDLLVETMELAKSVPTPIRKRDLVNFGITMALLLGTEAGAEVARTYRDEFAAKVRDGIAGTPGEQVRLMWLQNRIQFRHPLEKLLTEDLHTAVFDELNDITWDPIDPVDPFPGIARRILSTPLVGAADRRVRNLQHLARAYRVDGAINPCNWGCRQGSGSRGLVEAGLDAIGVPVLNLEVDCVDPRSFAEGQLRTRLEAFVEMIRSNPKPTYEAR